MKFKEMTDYIKNSVQVSHSNKPMIHDTSVNFDEDDNNLANPNSKICCLVLFIYSMEFGSPPLYHEINKVCRTMDRRYLHSLGPYIKALGLVTALSEKNRKDDDKI